MTLSILISTIDQGIEKIAEILLAPRSEVQYIISHQYRDEKFLPIPKNLKREDVVVSQIQGQGLTKSRNNAIRLATGDICVIADDDVTYTNAYFDTILEVYKNNEIDVACFKICKEVGKNDYKKYPKKTIQIKSIQDHSPSSIEITFKRETVKKMNVFFDERFGLGSWLNGGGENLFVHDCINAGLIVKFFPYYIVQHPHDCTIVSFSKYHTRRVKITGAMDMRLHGSIAFLKVLPKTLSVLLDLFKHGKNPFSYFIEYFNGVFYIFNNRIKHKQ